MKQVILSIVTSMQIWTSLASGVVECGGLIYWVGFSNDLIHLMSMTSTISVGTIPFLFESGRELILLTSVKDHLMSRNSNLITAYDAHDQRNQKKHTPMSIRWHWANRWIAQNRESTLLYVNHTLSFSVEWYQWHEILYRHHTTHLANQQSFSVIHQGCLTYGGYHQHFINQHHVWNLECRKGLGL